MLPYMSSVGRAIKYLCVFQSSTWADWGTKVKWSKKLLLLYWGNITKNEYCSPVSDEHAKRGVMFTWMEFQISTKLSKKFCPYYKAYRQ
jgi:hypothetical protein